MTFESSECVSTLLSHPLVLRSAWQRVKRFLSYGTIRDDHDFARWKVNPNRELLSLAKEIRHGTYRPHAFALIPHPKKNAILRHYVVPSVRDQVAFTAQAILLAPYLEAGMPNFSFGNRWYRGIYRSVRDEDPKWRHRRFNLSDGSMYQPFRRAHGLYKRVAHWSVSRMLNVEPNQGGATGAARKVEDYPEQSLPPFVTRQWWKQGAADSPRPEAYWCTLDLQLAYPSVSLNLLEERMLALLKEPARPGVGRHFGVSDEEVETNYPYEIRKYLANESCREELVRELCHNLRQIEYKDVSTHDKGWQYWRPAHAQQSLPSLEPGEHRGLPTGLGISGLLLNVYLAGLDQRMAEWIARRQSQGQRPPIFLRFADDMTVVAPDLDTLMESIDKVWQGINWEDANVTLAEGLASSNLSMNWAKVGPKPISEKIRKYLLKHHWIECDDCGEIHFPAGSGQSEDTCSLQEWWSLLADQSFTKEELKELRLHEDNQGPFVTYLVERMSAVGRERSDERFGHKAEERLIALHELIRFDFDDAQVRTDTRMAYAANRLVRAWLPVGDSEDQGRQIHEIRQSVGRAVYDRPWKPSLWRAVVRAAVRRPFPEVTKGGNPKNYKQTEVQNAAETWLKSLLAHISISSTDDPRSWVANWPEAERAPCGLPQADDAWKDLYLSYLRTTFWNFLADAICSVRQAIRSTEPADGQEPAARASKLSSWHWLFRCLPTHQYGSVLGWLTELDRWARVLYPDPPEEFVPQPWEVNGLCRAVLATGTWADILDVATLPFDGWLQVNNHSGEDLESYPFECTLGIPSQSLGQHQFTRRILEPGRPATSQPKPNPRRIMSHLSLVPGADADAKTMLGNFVGSLAPLSEDLELCQSLNALQYLPTKVADYWQEKVPVLLQQIESNAPNFQKLNSLTTYQAARQLLLSLDRTSPLAESGADLSLSQLLWAFPSDEGDTFHHPTPTQIPPVGLPTRVALYYFWQALEGVMAEGEDNESNFPPNWRFIPDDGEGFAGLSMGRRHQLGVTQILPGTQSLEQLRCSGSMESWDILPHPLHLLPRTLYDVPYGDENFQQWVHVLHLFVALEGHEAFLDRAFANGFGNVDFKDRWYLRGRIHLPAEIWEKLDKILHQLERDWSGTETSVQLTLEVWFEDPFHRTVQELREEIKELLDPPVSTLDFAQERVDVRLDINRDMEQIRTVAPHWTSPASAGETSPDGLQPEYESLKRSMHVRIGQLTAEPDWRDWLRRFPDMSRSELEVAMRQFLSTINAASSSAPNGMDLVILPEVAIPHREISLLKHVVRDTGVAIFTGLMWKQLEPVAAPHRSQITSAQPQQCFFVNEASLLIPLYSPNESSFPIVREFRFRKPRPANMEFGLADYLSSQAAESGNPKRFQILPGTRWFRFVHPSWGDFTIGICADLLDPAPWRTFQGEILHLFLAAYNKDVDLYDSLSWVRAYENFANVVVTNHGQHGGSFAWSPKRQHSKEVARLRGQSILITADIELPVRDLYDVQCRGQELARDKMKRVWEKIAGKDDKKECSSNDENRRLQKAFKSVPPRFRRNSPCLQDEDVSSKDPSEATGLEESTDSQVDSS